MSNSSVGLQALLSMGYFPEKNTGVGCHFLLLGDLTNTGIDLLHLQADSLSLSQQGSFYITTEQVSESHM